MENSRYDSDVVEIDLGEIVALLWHRAWLIILCAIFVAAAAFGISKFMITEQFESTTKVYILNKQDNSQLTYSDVQLGSQLTKDYAQLIKSRYVLEKVINDYGLAESYESFAGSINVTIPSDTRIISITVTDENPTMAQFLADEVRKVAADHIKNVMDIQAVNVVDEANLPENPASPSVFKWTAVGFMIGAFLCAAIILVHFMLDDTIKTSDDVERYLNLSTLAMIPVKEEVDKTDHRRSHGRSYERRQEPADDKEEQVDLGEVSDDSLIMLDVEEINKAVKEGK